MIRTLVCMVRCSDGRSGKICRHAILLMVVDGVAKNQSPTQKADGSPVAAAAAAAAAQTSLCGQLATDERIGMHTFVSSREDMSDRYMKVAPSLLQWTGRVYETFP